MPPGTDKPPDVDVDVDVNGDGDDGEDADESLFGAFCFYFIDCQRDVDIWSTTPV